MNWRTKESKEPRLSTITNPEPHAPPKFHALENRSLALRPQQGPPTTSSISEERQPFRHLQTTCQLGRLPIAQRTSPIRLTAPQRSVSVKGDEAPPRFAVFAMPTRWEHPVANSIITLTTDYGTNDHLAGTLKGVILKIVPDATVVDITHQVNPFDLLDGALAIGSAYSYFPPRTIHIVVVDPGVGTERRPLLVSAGNQYFVAPDNGVLSVIYERETDVVARHANVEHYYLQPLSKTFHGRDIFAPVAAWLAKGAQIASMGDEISDFKRFAMPKPKASNGHVKGVVMRVDSFGNLLTNFRAADIPEAALSSGAVNFKIGTHAITKMVDTFARGAKAEPVAFVGSSGYIEIAVNKGNASQALAIGRGAAVLLTP
jgi:S-adenosylmethionine hydrolase